MDVLDHYVYRPYNSLSRTGETKRINQCLCASIIHPPRNLFLHSSPLTLELFANRSVAHTVFRSHTHTLRSRESKIEKNLFIDFWRAIISFIILYTLHNLYLSTALLAHGPFHTTYTHPTSPPYMMIVDSDRVPTIPPTSRQNSATSASGNDEKLKMPIFDVGRFKQQNQHVSTDSERKRASEILRKKPEHREPGELAFLSKFLGTITFFAKFSEKLLYDLAQICKFSYKSQFDTIFKEGELADCVYVVLSGSVATPIRDYMNDVDRGYSKSTLQTAGEFIGGAALVSIEAKRPVTKMAVADGTALLRMDRDDYTAIMEKSLASEMKKKVAFCRSLPMFDQCSMKEFYNLASKMRIETFSKNQVILEQGAVSDALYFIQSGECRVVKRVLLAPFKPDAQNRTRLSFSSAPKAYRKVLSARGPGERERAREGRQGGRRNNGSLTARGATEGRSKNGGNRGNQTARTRNYNKYYNKNDSKNDTRRDLSHRHGNHQYQPQHGRRAKPNKNHQQQQQYHSNQEPQHPSHAEHTEYNQTVSTNHNHNHNPPPSRSHDHARQPRSSQFNNTFSSNTTNGGKRVQLVDLGRLRAKAHFGELGVLVDRPSPSFVYAETVVACLLLPKEFYSEFVPHTVRDFLFSYMYSFFPAQQQVQTQYHQHQRWELFKERILQRVQKK